MGEARRLSALDRLLDTADRALRTVAAEPLAERPSPAAGLARSALADPERRRSARLMRVNHAGEIAAQGLYHGQSLVARRADTRRQLLKAAGEEGDHLAWCRQRLQELDAAASRLDPVWYLGAFCIGVAAGLAGDRVSLGFIDETERPGLVPLDGHLQRLPDGDERSRAILTAMARDEAHHGRDARAAGGRRPPWPVRRLMRSASRVMTVTARYF